MVALASLVVCVVVPLLGAVLGWPSGGTYLLYGPMAAIFLGMGWLIAERQPGNVVGWLLVAFGALFAWYLPADLALHLAEPPPGAAFAALFISVLDAPIFIAIAWTLILFPDGGLPGRGWRWTVVLGCLGIGLAIAGYALSAEPFPLYPDYHSPVGIPGVPAQGLVGIAYAITLVLLVAAAVALIGRWRRGGPLLRAQIKWVVAATFVMVLTEIFNVATFDATNANASTVIVASIGIVLVPIAIGAAVLRYRLYEIDRVISRTLGYAIVTAILALVFAGVNLLAQGALSLVAAGESVAVAASTLVVFALFQPVRQRVQRTVDHRFDRARYDGELIAAGFSGRLRYETDMETVTTDLAHTASSAISPASLSIWIRVP